MGNENSKKLYIPFKQIMGRKNADGTYTLEAGDLKQLNDILYAICKKIMGRLTLSDLTIDTKTTFNDMVTFTDLATGGSTVINGDNIQTGTIRGITLISISPETLEPIVIQNGEITLGQSAFGASLKYDGQKVYLNSNLSPLKLSTLINMSLDAGSGMTIYIGTDNNGEHVTIGNAGGEVRLVGNVYINGVLQQ